MRSVVRVTFGMSPEGSYREIFRNISKEISFKKLHRYSPKQIIKLNHSGMPYGERECSVCHRHNYLKDGETECEICWALKQMSGNILKCDFLQLQVKRKRLAFHFRETVILSQIRKVPFENE